LPNIKSVMKDVKKSRERRLRNASAKSALKTYTKKTKHAIETAADNMQEMVTKTVSFIDKTAKRGIIHKNAAARRKSRLMKKANA
jgi:small subunit ribosomal protein S20